jgi:plastocyanin
MRSLPQKVKNPRTELQMMQRAKFALTLNFLKPMNGLLRTGWKLYAHRQSPINAAMSYTLANAIAGTFPDYTIDASKVYVSRGSLTPAANATATAAAGRTVTFAWDDNSGTSAAKETDKALIAVVNPAKSEAVFDAAGAERSAGTQSVNLPADWVGENVEAYIGFISEDGKDVANSVYLGSITVV